MDGKIRQDIVISGFHSEINEGSENSESMSGMSKSSLESKKSDKQEIWQMLLKINQEIPFSQSLLTKLTNLVYHKKEQVSNILEELKSPCADLERVH